MVIFLLIGWELAIQDLHQMVAAPSGWTSSSAPFTDLLACTSKKDTFLGPIVSSVEKTFTIAIPHFQIRVELELLIVTHFQNKKVSLSVDDSLVYEQKIDCYEHHQTLYCSKNR
jgi:hypothetical protein